MSDFAQENFSGIAVIKAFVKEFKELLAFRKLNVENEKANVEFTKASTLLNILVTLFVESVVCIILGYGGYLVYKGVFNAGELMEFIGYFNAIVWPVMAVSQLIEMSSRGKTSLKRVSDLLDAKSDVTDRPGVKDLKKVDGNIEYRHLSFSYPGSEREVLEDVSFKVAAGENVGIVGKPAPENHHCRFAFENLQRSGRDAFRGRRGRQRGFHKIFARPYRVRSAG